VNEAAFGEQINRAAIRQHVFVPALRDGFTLIFFTPFSVLSLSTFTP